MARTTSDDRAALLDWVEQAAQENIRFHLRNADQLAKEATATLALILMGLGATLAHGIQGLSGALTPAHAASLALAAYLTGLAVMVVLKCMKIAPIPAPANEPGNLYQPSYPMEKLREAELRNLQERIQDAVDRNDALTGNLNRLRLAATLGPVIWVAAFSLWPRHGAQETAEALSALPAWLPPIA